MCFPLSVSGGAIKINSVLYLELLRELATEAIKHGQVEGTKVRIKAEREGEREGEGEWKKKKDKVRAAIYATSCSLWGSFIRLNRLPPLSETVKNTDRVKTIFGGIGCRSGSVITAQKAAETGGLFLPLAQNVPKRSAGSSGEHPPHKHTQQHPTETPKLSCGKVLFICLAYAEFLMLFGYLGSFLHLKGYYLAKLT